jgi:hypothetical protein
MGSIKWTESRKELPTPVEGVLNQKYIVLHVMKGKQLTLMPMMAWFEDGQFIQYPHMKVLKRVAYWAKIDKDLPVIDPC